LPGGFHTRDTTAAGRRKRNWSSRCAVETLDEALGEYNPVEGGLITPKQARRRGAQAPFCAGSSPPSCSVLRLSFVETGQEHSGAWEERFHADGHRRARNGRFELPTPCSRSKCACRKPSNNSQTVVVWWRFVLLAFTQFVGQSSADKEMRTHDTGLGWRGARWDHCSRPQDLQA